jgi:hypothetical protein
MERGARAFGAVAAIGLIWWVAHSSNPSNKTPTVSSLVASDTAEEVDSDGADLSDTGADTSGVKGSQTYDEFDTRRDDIGGSAGTYGGYGCTEDCSGHEAGYQWAEDHGITDESDCGGNSWSFEEGCVAYAQEQSEDDSDSGDGSDEGERDDDT